MTGDERDVLHEDTGLSSLWTRVNIAEAVPGVPTPLTWSWFGPASDVGVGDSWVRMGVFGPERAGRRKDPGERMVAIHAGHPVLNLGILREVGDCLPGSSGDKIEQALFASDAVSEPSHPNWRRYPHVAVKMLPAIVAARRSLLERLPGTERWWSESLRALDGGSVSAARSLLTESFDRYSELVPLQSMTSLALPGLYDLVEGVCERHGLCGQAGALCTSNEPTPEARTVADLWRVSREELSLDRFLGVHGHHAPVQGELAAPSWRMDPSPLNALLGSYRQRGADEHPDVVHQRLEYERARTEQLLLSRVTPLGRPLVRRLLRTMRSLLPLREVARVQFMQCSDIARAAAQVIGAQLAAEGQLRSAADVYYLTMDEVVAGEAIRPGLTDYRRERKAHYETLELPMRFRGRPALSRITSDVEGISRIEGTAGSQGVYEGRARVIADPFDADGLDAGEVLVCETTNPSWASYFLVAGAVVVDIGGPLSHGPIVAREMGIPCVINTRNARDVVSTGDLIRVNGNTGVVEILKRS